jgi:hypothetical protein
MAVIRNRFDTRATRPGRVLPKRHTLRGLVAWT